MTEDRLKEHYKGFWSSVKRIAGEFASVGEGAYEFVRDLGYLLKSPVTNSWKARRFDYLAKQNTDYLNQSNRLKRDLRVAISKRTELECRVRAQLDKISDLSCERNRLSIEISSLKSTLRDYEDKMVHYEELIRKNQSLYRRVGELNALCGNQKKVLVEQRKDIKGLQKQVHEHKKGIAKFLERFKKRTSIPKEFDDDVAGLVPKLIKYGLTAKEIEIIWDKSRALDEFRNRAAHLIRKHRNLKK